MKIVRDVLPVKADTMNVTGFSTRLKLQQLAVAIGLFMVLGLAIAAVIAGSARNYRPDVALAARPADAYAAAQMAARLQPDSGLVGPKGLLEELATGAIRRDPTATRAARALALAYDEAGRDGEALQLASYSSALTHRDLPAQIYLVEHYMRERDIGRMFEHFQAAASTSREATSVLFPLIATAIGDPEIAKQLTSLLAKEPWWSPSMLSAIAQGAGPADAGARMFIRLAELGRPPRADIAKELVQRLESNGQRALAAKLADATNVELTPSAAPTGSVH